MTPRIEIAALCGSLGKVGQKSLRRALSLATPAVDAAASNIGNLAQRETPSLGLIPGRGEVPSVRTVTKNAALPLILCLIVRPEDLDMLSRFLEQSSDNNDALRMNVLSDPKSVFFPELAALVWGNDFAAHWQRLDSIRLVAPIILIAHTSPATSIAKALRRFEAVFRGYPEQLIRWIDVSDPEDGWRSDSWPAEAENLRTGEMRASAVVPAHPRSPLPSEGDDLRLHLDAPWCWSQPEGSKRASIGKSRGYSDPDKGLRIALEELLKTWLNPSGAASNAHANRSITIAPTAKELGPACLHPELHSILLPAAQSRRVFWQKDETGSPLLDIIGALNAQELADLQVGYDTISTEGAQVTGPATGERPDPEAAVRAYDALVNGQIGTLELLKPPDRKSLAKEFRREAELKLGRVAHLMMTDAIKNLKSRDTIGTLLSRLCQEQKDFLQKTPPSIESGRNKWGDHCVELDLTESARKTIARRIREVAHGIAIGEVQVMRFYWLRTLRPRFSDKIRSHAGLEQASIRLPVLEDIEKNFRTFALDNKRIEEDVVNEIDWPKVQRVPSVWNIKAFRGQFRKISRVLGLLFGLGALVGLNSEGLNTSSSFSEILGGVWTILSSPFTAAMILTFGLASLFIMYAMFTVSRYEILLDKQQAILAGLERAVETQLQGILSDWHKHLESSIKHFLDEFEDQASAFMQAPLNLAHAAHETMAGQLRTDADKAKAALTAQREERKKSNTRLVAARKKLGATVKRAVGTVGWKDRP